MPVYLNGLALQFYKGIGPDTQSLGPFKNFNFFIGANNAGKSTILEFLSKYLNSQDHQPARIPPLEQYRGEQTGPSLAAVGVPVAVFAEPVLPRVSGRSDEEIAKKAIFDLCNLMADDGLIWIRIPLENFRTTTFLKKVPDVESAFARVNRQGLDRRWTL